MGMGEEWTKAHANSFASFSIESMVGVGLHFA